MIPPPNYDSVIDDINFIFSKCDHLVEWGNRFKFHCTLQTGIQILSKKYGFNGVSEFTIPDRGDGRAGHIDVAWLDGKNNPEIIIEIDGSYREKSIHKLLKTTSNFKIWVYYGRDSPKMDEFPLGSGIEVILKRRIPR
jgi:hypothetical protein